MAPRPQAAPSAADEGVPDIGVRHGDSRVGDAASLIGAHPRAQISREIQESALELSAMVEDLVRRFVAHFLQLRVPCVNTRVFSARTVLRFALRILWRVFAAVGTRNHFARMHRGGLLTLAVPAGAPCACWVQLHDFHDRDVDFLKNEQSREAAAGKHPKRKGMDLGPMEEHAVSSSLTAWCGVTSELNMVSAGNSGRSVLEIKA
eukprot:SAG11_NODE_5943_length_1428_cov_1.758465_2_plen_205_part_00